MIKRTKNEAINYIIKTTSLIINLDTFEIVNIFRSNKNDSWLIHFASSQKFLDIEFFAELYDDNTTVEYFKLEDDLRKIEDLSTFVVCE